MRLVDTSAWIEWVSRTELDRQIVPLLPARTEWLVPTIVQFELSKWVARNSAGQQRGEPMIAFSNGCVVAPLSTEIALAAAAIGQRHQLAVADSIVYATARAFGADLLTCDAHFEGMAHVLFIDKRTQ
ncbi:MAG: type II toxin-antitoxin system VapC family toxin [Devosia sp.]